MKEAVLEFEAVHELCEGLAGDDAPIIPVAPSRRFCAKKKIRCAFITPCVRCLQTDDDELLDGVNRFARALSLNLSIENELQQVVEQGLQYVNRLVRNIEAEERKKRPEGAGGSAINLEGVSYLVACTIFFVPSNPCSWVTSRTQAS